MILKQSVFPPPCNSSCRQHKLQCENLWCYSGWASSGSHHPPGGSGDSAGGYPEESETGETKSIDQ